MATCCVLAVFVAVFLLVLLFNGNSIMQALGRFKLHILALLVVVAADATGIQKFGIVVLLSLIHISEPTRRS